MEQTLPINQSSVPTKVKVWRNIAAFLLSLNFIWGIVNSIVYIGYSELRSIIGSIIDLLFRCLLPIGAFVMLAYAASNRPTRNMMYVLIGKQVVCILLVVMFNFYILPASTWSYWNILNSLISAYALSVVLRSNQMEANGRGWVGLMFVGLFIDLEWYLNGFLQLHFYGDGTGPDYFVETFSKFRIIWQDVWSLMMIIVWFKFAQSCAFSGKFQSASPVSGTYTPLNKYMAAVVLIAGFVMGLLWVYYEYAAPALRML